MPKIKPNIYLYNLTKSELTRKLKKLFKDCEPRFLESEDDRVVLVVNKKGVELWYRIKTGKGASVTVYDYDNHYELSYRCYRDEK